MQSERFLLTFAIPTYNRSGHLAQLLSVLLPQLEGETRVELIVCDNASPDDTSDVVREFQGRGLRAIYIRNETNIGPDANFLQCFQRARGKYVWLFGDDDALVPGALRRIIEMLEDEDFDLVYLTPYGYTKAAQLQNLNLVPLDPVIYSNAENYLRRVTNMFTFISSNIINKERLAEASNIDFSSYIGTNLIQLSWTYAALNNFRSGLFVPQVTVLSLSENSGGFGICRVMGVNLSTLARGIIKSQRMLRILENASLRGCLPFYLLKMKESTTYTLNPEPAHEILSARFGSNLNYWLFPYPIIQLPPFFARRWLFVCRVFNKIHKLIFVVLAEKSARNSGALREAKR